MTTPLIAPLIPPRARPVAWEHGRPGTARRLPMAAAPDTVSRDLACANTGASSARSSP